MARSYEECQAALSRTPLFAGGTWRVSPEAWPLCAAQVAELERVGGYCLEFHRALARLYTLSWQGESILRNRDLRTPWVADYLERGKPERLVRHSRNGRIRRQLPIVIRPDLLLTEEGFALTEIDSVPGGIGITAFLNDLYGGAGEGIVGAGGMLAAFLDALRALVPGVDDPLVAILVSDESSSYRPEMDYAAAAMRGLGGRVHCRHCSEIFTREGDFFVEAEGGMQKVDLVYRFWELFDSASVPLAGQLLDAAEAGRIIVTAPMNTIFEEKLNLALFHHHLLRDYWRDALSEEALGWLLRSVPRSWVLDPAPLPPGAMLDGPALSGRPMHDWRELADASQKERSLIVKISGFDADAWGARGVMFGGDKSRNEWQEGLRKAFARAGEVLHIVQEYRKPTRLAHPVFPGGGGEAQAMQGRVRLCPYYFVNGGEAALSGVLATFCPADKKIIHGMKDAALLPCRIGSGEG